MGELHQAGLRIYEPTAMMGQEMFITGIRFSISHLIFIEMVFALLDLTQNQMALV